MTSRDADDPYPPRQCPDIESSPDGFDGQRLTCKRCGYDHRLDGRYFRWATYPPPPPLGGECLRRGAGDPAIEGREPLRRWAAQRRR